MAAHGYERERFQSTVSIEGYTCPICLNVVKDPVMCRNEHPFCRGCIIRHLRNDQTCPVCKDYLTRDTLKKPSRFFTEPLSELRIGCEFIERGCEEIVQLRSLEKHVEKCGYAPVLCSNEGCQREVNRRDLTRHEYEECVHRKLKCHQCERLSQDVDILKQKMTGMEEKVEMKLDSLQKVFEDRQKNMDDSLTSLKRSNSRIKGNLKKLIKVMDSLSKTSRTETDNDDSDSSGSDSSGSDSSGSYPSQPTSVTTIPRAESTSSPSTIIPSGPSFVNTLPSAESNTSPSTSITHHHLSTRVNIVPSSENNSSTPSTSIPFWPKRLNTVPKFESNFSPSTCIPRRPTPVNTVPMSENNSTLSTSISFRPGVNTVPRSESNSSPSSPLPPWHRSVNALSGAENNYSPSLSSPSSFLSGNTLPWPDSNSSTSLSTPSWPTSIQPFTP